MMWFDARATAAEVSAQGTSACVSDGPVTLWTLTDLTVAPVAPCGGAGIAPRLILKDAVRAALRWRDE